MTVIQIISLRASTDEVIPQLQRFSASDSQSAAEFRLLYSAPRLQNALVQLTSHHNLANELLCLLNPPFMVLFCSVTYRRQNIKRRQKITKKHLPRKVSAHLQFFLPWSYTQEYSIANKCNSTFTAHCIFVIF